MSEMVKLVAKDGFELDGYVARPEGQPIAGLVVIQEIFGVNSHIRSVADGYARDGFLVVAPAIFDRLEKNVQLNYDQAGRARAMEFYGKIDASKGLYEKPLEDVEAAIAFLRGELGAGKKVGTIGFCYGGLLSWLSAARLKTDASVGYYAGGIGYFAKEMPEAPVMLHFGKKDTHIPAEQVDQVAAAHPEVQIFRYDDAGHAFNRDADPSSYAPAAAETARERSLEFLKEKLG